MNLSYYVILILFLVVSCSKDATIARKDLFNTEGSSAKVSLDRARKAALKIKNENRRTHDKLNLRRQISPSDDVSIAYIDEVYLDDSKNSIYVVNYQDSGFCLLSSSLDLVPMLAYSETGTFKVSDRTLNVGLDIWLNQLSEDITYAKSEHLEVNTHNRHEWSLLVDENPNYNTQIRSSNFNNQQRQASFDKRMSEIHGAGDGVHTAIPLSSAGSFLTPDVMSHFRSIAQRNGSPEQFTIVHVTRAHHAFEQSPLMNTAWHQVGRFAENTPNGYAGCTAVAAGQIMNYYKFPYHYNWSNMTNDRINSHSDISVFMEILGKEFKMSYKSDGSGAYNRDVASALRRFGYRVEEKDHLNWDVEANLKNNMPVYLTGCRTNAFLGLIYKNCHAWVAEGLRKYQFDTSYKIEWQGFNYEYQTDGRTYNTPSETHTYYYINWGWGSWYNGWFKHNLHINHEVHHDYRNTMKNLYIRR